ncbi:MAG: hypothetical protein WKF82_08740 [Nocardioidaceae bacterium]
MARTAFRPRNDWAITTATANGMMSSSGTLNTVKMPVAFIAFQKGADDTEPGWIRSR